MEQVNQDICTVNTRVDLTEEGLGVCDRPVSVLHSFTAGVFVQSELWRAYLRESIAPVLVTRNRTLRMGASAPWKGHTCSTGPLWRLRPVHKFSRVCRKTSLHYTLSAFVFAQVCQIIPVSHFLHQGKFNGRLCNYNMAYLLLHHAGIEPALS